MDGGSSTKRQRGAAARITQLIEDGRIAKEQGDFESAKRSLLQATIVASDIMEMFLGGDTNGARDTDITEQQLADWLAECSNHFLAMRLYPFAIRWLYTSMLFDGGGDDMLHKAAWGCWIYLLNDQHFELHIDRVYELLDKVYSTAQQAFDRGLFFLAYLACNHVTRVHKILTFDRRLCRRGFEMCKPLEQFHTTVKPICILRANCLYRMGRFDIVRKVCTDILTKMCDYDCVEALELGAMVLIQEEKYEFAEDKIQKALQQEGKGEEIEGRLIELLRQVQEKKKVAHEQSPEVDDSWLQGTAAQPDKQSKKEARVTGSPKQSGAKKKEKKKYISRYKESQQHAADAHGTKERPVNKKKAPKDKSIDRVIAESERDRSRSASECSVESNVSDWGKWTNVNDTDDCSSQAGSDTSSTNIFDTYTDEGEVVSEEKSFYEQSCEFFHSHVPSEDEMCDNALLKSGLNLNTSFLERYAGKHPGGSTFKDTFYEEFRPKEILREHMLKQPDVFIRCKLQIEGSHLSHCIPVDASTNIEIVEISGRSKAGQVYNDDEVVVQLLDLDHQQENKRYGKVIGVWERNRYKDVKHPVFICTLDDKEPHLVRPMCRTVPKISVLTEEINRTCPNMKKHKFEVYTYDHSSGTLTEPKIHDVNPGDLNKNVFLVTLINWKRQMIYPTGAIIRVLPYGESMDKGFMLLNLKHEVPSLYQKAVVDRTESFVRRGGDEIDKIHLEDRVDLTSQRVFTIDPPGSKDLDDALSIKKFGDGYTVGVHIADVSHFVKKGDPVDMEARQRATTFYPGIAGKLPRNMLPEPFSTKLCSLLPGKTRLTLSVFFHLSADGKPIQMTDSWFEVKKTYIKSCQQFTYREVQDIIDGKADHSVKHDINILHKLSASIRRERLGNSMSALEMSSEAESEDDVRETFEAHFLVEEFMVMASKAVATKLVRSNPDLIPLRCQSQPAKEKIDTFIKKNGMCIDTLVSLQDKHICDFKTPKLDAVIHASGQGCERPYVIVPEHLWDFLLSSSSSAQECSKLLLTDELYPLQHLTRQHWISIQERAEYKCSSGSKEKRTTLRHFSLNVDIYTHFTSPIRRYIDLVNHRILHAALDRAPCPYRRSEVESICVNVNSRTKQAKEYQRECKVFSEAMNLKLKPKMVSCYVDDVSDSGLTLSSPDLKHVAKVHKQLPFNLLDVGFKPELGQETLSGNEFVTATWRKRLYDIKGISSDMPSSNYADEKKVLNSGKGIVSLPLKKWANIVRCAVEGRQSDIKRNVRKAHARSPPDGLDDISTESLDPNKMQPHSIFSMTFKRGQGIQVQMAAMPWRGLIAPQPVLYNMTNNVKLCLLHMADPVLHLSEYATMKTCSQYRSADMYLKRWLPLLEMEATVCAVNNEESCFINNVPIIFATKSEGKIVFPRGFCEARNITFSGTSSEDETDEYSEEGGQAFDWLCLKKLEPQQEKKEDKCKVQVTSTAPCAWLGHARITSVTKKKTTKDDSPVTKKKTTKDDSHDDNCAPDGSIVVKFYLHKSPPLTEEIMGTDKLFSVEILRKSEVDRRTESYMKQLRSMDGSLAHTIALNKGAIPELDGKHIEMAAGIEHDLDIPPTDDVRPLPRNNRRQKEAIQKALTNRFTLIQGPPGTGKTYTGIKLVCLFDKINHMISHEGGQRCQVLFCGPSNKSVDHVAKLMLRRLGSLCPNFVRVYGRAIAAIDYPIPGRTFLSKRCTRDLKANPELSSVTLHHLIRQTGKPDAQDIRDLDRLFKDCNYRPELLNIKNKDGKYYQGLKEENPNSPDNLVKEYVRLIHKASITEIQQRDVILCTTAVGANPKVLKAADVFQVIVDEAGMCPEPQCLVPVIATEAKQVVLIGDHKQLRPIVKSKQAAELGLDTSLFERYAVSEAATSGVQFTMLDIQYRMDPSICRFPSKMFYNGKLQTGQGLWCNNQLDIWPRGSEYSYPHVLIPVEGEERALAVSTEEGNEHSRSNPQEADLVVKLFKYFMDQGVHPNDINIISQYNAQCAELRDKLTSQGFKNFNVTTVVSSQGGEWDYVIFSTVRSLPDYRIEEKPTIGWCKANLGFITDENQINVALTRARKGLVIVGNPKLLRCDKVWGHLIRSYEQTGCVLSNEEFPPPRRPRPRRQQSSQNAHENRSRPHRQLSSQLSREEGTGQAMGLPAQLLREEGPRQPRGLSSQLSREGDVESGFQVVYRRRNGRGHAM